ncbi:tyrosine/serine protein phosphatase [Skermanella aerolata KACC 11604]|nr:tyrosine/serine protein phosphatase [Skermanella aerolata KACC 11604]
MSGVILGSLMSVALGTGGLHLGILHLGDNFHAVVPGELYRSAQPTPELISYYQKEYGIKTVINLRGENVGTGWYDAELATTSKLGIRFVNFRMSAKREFTQERLTELMAVLREAEKPVLVHCTSGSDRSGLVSALYLAAVAKVGEEQADSQISFRYGHIPLWFNPPYAMQRSFEALKPVLGFSAS